MNRREFLVRVGGTLIVVPMVLEAVSCGNDSNPAAPSATDQFSTTSTTDTGHTHRITVRCTDLSSQSEIPYDSTTDGGHFHRITLTVSQLQQIAAGNAVGPLTSTIASGHTHNWTFQKPSNAC